jgi:Flavin containing amine oxidoreductase
MLMPDQGWSQQGGQSGWTQQGGQSGAHRSRGQAKENSAIPVTPAIEPTSSFGQALAACDKDVAVEETFALPGLKGEVTLDRCFKGHGHLICVFDALIAEAKSLTDTYTPVVEAKYPDFNSVENICQIKPDALASHMAGAEDFTKRFAVLKSKYESASKCAINIKQSFRDVVLADMTQPPEILKSMTESLEADVARVSDVENQTVDLAAKIEAAKKAMKTIEKIYRAMCMKDKTTVIGRTGNADPSSHLTASTAVLASGKILFRPNLPGAYASALEKLKLGSYDHVALAFNGNPLGLDANEVIFERVRTTKTAALFANVHGTRLSLLTLAGRSGAEVADKGENAMTDFALDWISGVFGSRAKKAVLSAHATSWNKDPWTLGAFSSALPGAQEARKTLSEPLNDVVWFAGEAVHQTFWGTVGGAWQNGELVADSVIARLDQKPSRSAGG